MRSSVDLWYLQISLRATVPGLKWCGCFTPPDPAGVLFCEPWEVPPRPVPLVPPSLADALFMRAISCVIPTVKTGIFTWDPVLCLYTRMKFSMSFLSHPFLMTACKSALVNPLLMKTFCWSGVSFFEHLGNGLPILDTSVFDQVSDRNETFQTEVARAALTPRLWLAARFPSGRSLSES